MIINGNFGSSVTSSNSDVDLASLGVTTNASNVDTSSGADVSSLDASVNDPNAASSSGWTLGDWVQYGLLSYGAYKLYKHFTKPTW